MVTARVKKILSYYESDNPGTKNNIARVLMHGKLAGTGRLVILPIDQGFEHGPARSFAVNPAAYDPHYHYKLAIKAGLSAYAAPLGLIEAGADTFAGAIPTILKMNSNNALMDPQQAPDQAITATVQDALRLGCSGIGFTIYPGSDASLEMYEEVAQLTAEAKEAGLMVVIWSYPRGNLSKAGETALDVVAYGAHIACLLGAHLIKAKLPSAHLELPEAKAKYQAHAIPLNTLEERIRHVVQTCFNGRRLVIFSGGESKDINNVLEDARAIYRGGGAGSIIGRNAFQRPEEQALVLLGQLVAIFKNTGN